MKTQLYLLFFVSLGIINGNYAYAQADGTILQGTIGPYSVVMSFWGNDTDGYDGNYFYKTNGRNIRISGNKYRDSLKLVAMNMNDKTSDEDTSEIFMLKNTSNNYTGTWTKIKGKTLTVTLAPVDVNTVRNPYASLPGVQKMKKGDPLDYIRTSAFEIVSDRERGAGKYLLHYQHVKGTNINLFSISGGDADAMKQANIVLKDALIDEANSYLSCTGVIGAGDYNYTLGEPYITGDVLSVYRHVDYDCGGAHPDDADEPININLKTGALLQLEDVLRFDNNPIPVPNSDNWLTYRSDKYAPKLVKLLTTLYPSEMQVPKSPDEDPCDYTTTDVWSYVQWWFTPRGLYLSPYFAHIVAPCREPEWSYIPYNELKKHGILNSVKIQ